MEQKDLGERGTGYASDLSSDFTATEDTSYMIQKEVDDNTTIILTELDRDFNSFEIQY